MSGSDNSPTFSCMFSGKFWLILNKKLRMLKKRLIKEKNPKAERR